MRGLAMAVWMGLGGGCAKAPAPSEVESPRLAPPVAGARIGPPADGAVGVDAPAPAAAVGPVGLPGGGMDRVPAAVMAAARADAAKSWARLAAFCDHAGPRLAGSAGLERAIAWAAAGFAADRVPVVRQEPVRVPVWVRGHEAARMVAPVAWDLAILGLGGTVPTPAGGIEAEVVRAASLDAVPPEAAGRIVLFDVPMAEGGRPSKHYGPAARVRGGAPVAAAKAGAVGVLVRSVTTRSLRSPHTGATYYAEGVPKIPAAAVSTEDADRLTRELARGPVRVRLELASATGPDAPSANVVAEIPGATLPGEVVLIGAHIDSWDVGQGAHDDGAGVIEVMEAMRLLVAQGERPKRTIRAVLFTNEENGLRGGLGYAAAHGGEVHVAAIESDLGGGRPEAWSATGTPAQLALLREAAAPLGVPVEEGGGGADIGPLKEKGVMVVGLVPDHRAYFDVHHTEADTVDKVDPAAMAEATGALAALAWRLANH